MLFYFISLENRYNFLFIFGQLGRIRKIYYDVITKIFYTSYLFIISILRSNIFAFQSSEDNASLLCRVLQSCLSIIYYQWMHHDLVLEKILESTLDYREIQPVHCKGNKSWIFFGSTDAEAETPMLWPPDANNWLIWKDADAGKDWGPEEKGTTENEMVGWHHWLDGHVFEQAPGVGDGQGGLACCSSWGHKESDTTEQLNWTEHQLPSKFLRFWKKGYDHPEFYAQWKLEWMNRN